MFPDAHWEGDPDLDWLARRCRRARLTMGMALGYYGLAWSVYSNAIAKGGEVEFEKNAMLEIRFGGRTPPNGSKFR